MKDGHFFLNEAILSFIKIVKKKMRGFDTNLNEKRKQPQKSSFFQV
jgi:hypothetical protein